MLSVTALYWFGHAAAQPSPDEWMSLGELCNRLAVDRDSQIDVDCSIETRAQGLLGVRVSWSDGTMEEIRLVLARPRRGRFAFVADVHGTINSGGNHGSDAHWLRIRPLARNQFTAEITLDAWFSYPNQSTSTWHHNRAIAVCTRMGDAATCTHSVGIDGHTDEAPTGYDWHALGERWWAHRLPPGEGDVRTRARLTVAETGLLRAELVESSGHAEGVELPGGRYLRFAPRAPSEPTLEGRVVPPGADPNYGFQSSGTFEQLCGQLGEMHTTCALQRIDARHSFLVVQADYRRIVFLVLTRGDRLTLRARMIDRFARDGVLTTVDLHETRSLPGGRLGYVYEDRAGTTARRYLLVCEHRSERCVARVPLRVLTDDVALSVRDDRLVPRWVTTSEAEAEVRDDVLRLRLKFGQWGELFEDEESPPTEGQTVEMELPQPDSHPFLW